MSADFLKSCLDLLASDGLSSEAFQRYFMHVKQDLLADASVAIGLTVLIGHREEDEDVRALFRLLLDEARMGLENDSLLGPSFLENVEMAVGAGLNAGAMKPHHLAGMAVQYRHAGLPVPNILTLDLDSFESPDGVENLNLEDHLQDLTNEVLEAGGNAYSLFNALSDMTAALPDDIVAGFVNHIAGMENPAFEQCVLYFLLSGSALTQEAAAAGLIERLEKGGLSVDTLVFLPIIRGWLPAGTCRDIVDDLGKRARRKDVAGSFEVHAPGLILEIVASITDGVGAQNISITVEHNGKMHVAMVMTKLGYGVKDAFVVPNLSLEEADNIVESVRFEANGENIELATLTMLLQAALSDGVLNSKMPAPGFLDVMKMTNLFDLRPQAMSLQELLKFVDPDKDVQAANPQKLGRWINSEIGLDFLAPLTCSWFEDTAETRNIVMTGRTAQSIENKIWKYMEGRRDIWAKRFLQTAAILRDSDRPREWQTLTASAFGLLSGRPLKRIPLMEDVVYTTIEAADASVW